MASSTTSAGKTSETLAATDGSAREEMRIVSVWASSRGSRKASFQRHVEVENVGQDLQQRGKDGATARCAEGVALAAGTTCHQRTHVGEWADARHNAVRMPRHGVKPHDAVVEQHAERRSHFGAEAGQQGVGQGDDRSVSVHHAEIAGAGGVRVGCRARRIGPICVSRYSYSSRQTRL